MKNIHIGGSHSGPLHIDEKLTSFIKNQFIYEPESGQIYRRDKKTGGFRLAGYDAVAQERKYRKLKILNKPYFAHRVAWLLNYGRWPEGIIDHIDGDGLNNKITNLRDVKNAENQRNSRMQKNNKSGANGVGWNKRDKKWYAQVKVDGKTRHIGYFDSIEEAAYAQRSYSANHGFTHRHGLP